MKKSLGVYVHIPFCVRKCNYCDFLSSNYCNKDEDQNKLVRDYVNALIKEIEIYSKELQEYKVQTIYIGGGTPSSIDSELIGMILEKIKESFDVCDNPEITIEVNPGTLLNDKVEDYKKMGINRVSMGLQSANNKELKALGRIHTYEEFLESYRLLRSAGFNNINIDVMSAIPNQSVESYIDTLNKVISLHPEHISSYSLIIEEETYFYEKQDELKLVSEDDEREMYYKTKEILQNNGYERYEISNYSLKGMESRHNSSYWIGTEYIGFGLGASSYLKDYRYDRIRNIDKYIEVYNNINVNLAKEKINDKKDSSECNDNTDRYIDNNVLRDYVRRNIECKKEKLSIQNKIEEYMFLGLRMTKGISISKFKEVFDKDIHDVYGAIIDKYISMKLITEENDYLRLTEKGIDVSNTILSDFLL